MFRRAPFIWTAKQPIDPLGYWNQFFGGVARRDDGDESLVSLPPRLHAAGARPTRRR